tara:strand:- start:155 stop:310 length:156 start_codon:yes stop_codon:yes gene_type:complete
MPAEIVFYASTFDEIKAVLMTAEFEEMVACGDAIKLKKIDRVWILTGRPQR